MRILIIIVKINVLACLPHLFRDGFLLWWLIHQLRPVSVSTIANHFIVQIQCSISIVTPLVIRALFVYLSLEENLTTHVLSLLLFLLSARD